MNYRKSLIDESWKVITLEKSDQYYENFKSLFNQFGTGIGDLKNLSIYIDGEQVKKHQLTDNHIYAIEAHEIGHFILDHAAFLSEININEELLEREADFAAYNILLKYKFITAAKLIKQRYLEHYGEHIVDFPIKKSQLLKIQKYLDETENI
jgi:hypothetical protein